MHLGGPTLSVVMANYNHGRYLAEAILGIATQSRPPDEFLILDDASTDDSLRIIESFARRFPRIRLLRHERNLGVIAAYQRLFAEARGDYVFAPAVDDIRLPGFLELAMGMAERHPQAGLVFGVHRRVDEQGRHLQLAESQRWKEPLYADPRRFLREYLEVELPSHSPAPATIYRRDALLEVGGYPDGLGSWADTFAFRAIGLKYGVCYFPVEVVHCRVLAGSFSQQIHAQPRKMLRQVARATAFMRSPAFRERFPADYVRRWRRAMRWRVIWDYFLGPEPAEGPRPPFLVRNVRRLPRVLPALLLCLYPLVPERRGGLTEGK